MNYRELLKKYIRHLHDVEGSDFINHTFGGSPVLTDDERDELRRLRDESASPGSGA